MPSCLHLVALLVAACFLAGWGTGPSQRAHDKQTKATNASADADEDRSPEAIERRTEAHARYAAGVVLDLNDNPEAAVEEYFKAALPAVRDEELVLEVTRRLLQLRKQDKAIELLKKAPEDPNSSGQLYA